MFPSAHSSPPPDSDPSRKRKHAALTSSPPPLHPAQNLLPIHPFTQPRLTISPRPLLVPVADGSEYFTTEQIAVNRIGFRYTPAGLAPPGSILPARTTESAPTCFRVSWEDRSPFVKVTPDGLGLSGDKGFRSARCNVPVRQGRWYMEVKIEHGGGEHAEDSNKREGSHVRLGWGRREAPLNGPVGLDGYSYGFRDKTGEKITLSRPRPYGRPFASGDVIGMYISLPPLRNPNMNDPHDPAHIKRERIPIEFKGQAYFESLEYPQSKEMISLMDYSNKSANSAPMPPSSKKSATVKNLPDRARAGNKLPEESAPLRPLPALHRSLIAFFINGECQGPAFVDVYDYLPLSSTKSSRKGKEKKRSREGTVEHKENPFDDGSLGYYPFISLFNNARVRLNPGPDFEFPPPPDIDSLCNGHVDAASPPPPPRTWRPISERYSEYFAEQAQLDDREEDEAKFEAARRAALESAEAEKKAQKEKKRQQAEARKRAKKVAAGDPPPPESSSVATPDDDRFGPIPLSATLQTMVDQGFHVFDLGSQTHSPAPTFTSSVDIHGGAQSGCNSDYGEVDENREREEVSSTLLDIIR